MEESYVRKLDSVEFGFFSASEAKKIGLVEITSPLVYDSLKKPITNGFADPKLGVSIGNFETSENCAYCSHDINSCQGHLGYLPLITPVFNPFTIDLTFKLLKSKCSFCHRLKIEGEKSLIFILKKKLGKRGKLIDARMVEEIFINKILNDSAIKEFDELRDKILDDKSLIEDLLIESSSSGKSDNVSSTVKHRNEANSQFWKNFSTTCPHCKAPQPKMKKEGDNKITRLALKEK